MNTTGQNIGFYRRLENTDLFIVTLSYFEVTEETKSPINFSSYAHPQT